MSDQALSLQLRERTAASHQALEDGLAILRADRTLADYRVILRAFRGYLGPWLRRVEVQLPEDLRSAVDGRRLLERLDRDIAQLEAGVDLVECTALPEVNDFAAAMGSCYVIEGSMLGARVVGPALQRRFDLTPERGCAYFGGDGADTGRRWSFFRDALDNRVAPAEHAAAVRAADQTFQTLLQWFKTCGVARAETTAL